MWIETEKALVATVTPIANKEDCVVWLRKENSNENYSLGYFILLH
jgi:hypothetical protein